VPPARCRKDEPAAFGFTAASEAIEGEAELPAGLAPVTAIELARPMIDPSEFGVGCDPQRRTKGENRLLKSQVLHIGQQGQAVKRVI
jgi:hypothetical protein